MSFARVLVATLVVLSILSALYITPGNALIHDLNIVEDGRSQFFIENFGFAAQGHLRMRVSGFQLTPGDASKAADYKVGFLIKHTETDSARFLQEAESLEGCLLDSMEVMNNENDRVALITNWTQQNFARVIQPGEEGFYNYYFVNCEPDTWVSFDLKLVQYNVDANGSPNFMSVGDDALPALYFLLFLLFLAATLLWVYACVRAHSENPFKVKGIHHLMTVAISVKALSLLFKAIETYFLQVDGHPGSFAAIYFLFTFLKGVFMFVVIALIGSGWSLLKPFLSDRDKKIFLFVITLQILDNLALVVMEETAPGSRGWFTAKDLFRLIDIICCGAILIPIISSIQHLKEAAQVDDKAAMNMNKLQLFRQFYLTVVGYIYFTRIIIYLLDATLPYRLSWVGPLVTETATLLFYVITGFTFRPVEDN
eukprot:CAMPEP_0174244490 /NCGR_PEP_ID=MMETSP0417-20130205/35392_1 /TAXON_ID=242541 /ORGANISM="Mayorella sp, Strain BSH-02190019" /LENGTH=424 /DNA_ID=CAMNT_0015324177 /DNA_START=72 /DNA_END=1343 /DNA_ORIENTATION=-